MFAFPVFLTAAPTKQNARTMKMPTSIHLLIIAVVLLVVGSNAEEEQHSGVRAFTA
jgi:hypothetical protein